MEAGAHARDGVRRCFTGLALLAILFLFSIAAPTLRAGDFFADHGGKRGADGFTRWSNDVAMKAALQAGVVVSFSGRACFLQPIEFLRDASAGLVGDGVTSEIDSAGTDYAVKIVSGGAGPTLTYRKQIEGLQIVGDGGLYVEAGGKFVIARDLVLRGRTKPGLRAKWCDGMAWENVYCHGGGSDGAQFDNCHMDQFARFTSRDNAGRGLVVDTCSAWSGSLYLESNRGLGGDFTGLRRSSLSLWIEANGGPRGDSGSKFSQARRRGCIGNVWAGQTHDDQRWDDDAVSRAFNRTATDALQFPPAGEVLAENLTPRINGPMAALVDVKDGTLTFHAGAFAQRGNIEFLGLPADSFKAGDWFVVECEIGGDTAALEFFGETPFVRLSTLGSQQLDLAENVFPTPGRKFCFPTAAKQDGSGLRLFGNFLVNAGPERDVKLTIKNVTVRRVGP